MEHEQHLEKMTKMSEMMGEVCSMMDEMKQMMDEMVGGTQMGEEEYMASSPEKRSSYDKMKMMSKK